VLLLAVDSSEFDLMVELLMALSRARAVGVQCIEKVEAEGVNIPRGKSSRPCTDHGVHVRDGSAKSGSP
jgi:hypothetical protein